MGVAILVITVREYNKSKGRVDLVTSHGIDLVTGKNVVLPVEHPLDIGAVWSESYREYILEDKK